MVERDRGNGCRGAVDMHDVYFSSVLVSAGLCLGLSIQSTLVGFSSAPAGTARSLSRLVLLEAAYCVGFYVFATVPASWDLRWYSLLPVVPLAFLPGVLGDLVMGLTGAPRGWGLGRRLASSVAWIGVGGMLLDAALDTEILSSGIQVFGRPFSLRLPVPTWGGFAFLACWGSLVFVSMGRLVAKARTPQLRPLLYGAGSFGAFVLFDLYMVVFGRGNYLLQHLGFLSLLLGAWSVLARQHREGAERLRVALERLEEQQHQLLHEGPRVQQQKLESLGTLAAGIAHEVLNPLTSIMNYAQLIRQRGSQVGAMGPFVDEVMAECRRVTAIVRNLLTFARREDLIRLPEDPREMVEETFRLVGSSLSSDGIQLELVGGMESLSVQCTRQQIQQVLLNLLQNAQNALNVAYPGSHADKRIRLSIASVSQGDVLYVRVDVEDWGTGISEADLPRVFDPFFTNRPDRSGTGLGLSVSHGIVVDHGGRLEVDSVRGRYTRFSLFLPAEPRETLRSGSGSSRPRVEECTPEAATAAKH
ncbi:MAG: ATP-binding protein [Myxococcales bacterium]|nr:ATP-binding protein [Myxococcales bacterium]